MSADSQKAPIRRYFKFRPAVKADKAGVLAISTELFNGFDYMEWQFDLLVDSPVYFPWVCEHAPTGQIVSFVFGFAAEPGDEGSSASTRGAFSMAGARTRKEFQSMGLLSELRKHVLEQATGGQVSSVSAILSVYNQPHLLAEGFPSAAQGPKSAIHGRVVLHHSCLAFEMTPTLRNQLRAAAAEESSSSSSSVFQEVASPAAFLADEPPASASGIGLGLGDYLVLSREVAVACPDSLVRLGHWIRCALASRTRQKQDEPQTLTGLSFATRYPCGAGSNLVLNIYSKDEAATSEHIVAQLRRYLGTEDVEDIDGERKTVVTAFFRHGLCHNEILSRIHLNKWLGGGCLPLSNLPNAFCALRVTRAELRGGGGDEAASRASL